MTTAPTPIPLLNGVVGNKDAHLLESYPVNLEPIVIDSGLSKGYLHSAPGVTTYASAGYGADRGALTWNGVCYRVMGAALVKLTLGGVTKLGAVYPGGPVSMDYSFDRLAIAAGGYLYYWNGTLSQVTDPDLGTVIDMIWVDGYFMTTDGTSLVVTELNDPLSVDPNKYGSSEVDPDSVVALKKVRGQVYAINRNTIENFQNVGGSGFPFTRNAGGMIPKGAVGTHAVCYFLDTFAFVGGGRNEGVSVYLAGQGQALPMSTAEIDGFLADLTPAQLATIEIESKTEENEQRLYIHLPDKTLVYNHQASRQNESPVWHILAGGVQADQEYPARHFALADNRWYCGSATGDVGYLDQSVETQFGAVAGWRFDTTFIQNDTKGGIIQSVELVGQPGHAPFGEDPTCFLSITLDGETWGLERAISMGEFGERRKRVQWRPGRKFSNYMGLRFRGANTAMASWSKLMARIEPLNA